MFEINGSMGYVREANGENAFEEFAKPIGYGGWDAPRLKRILAGNHPSHYLVLIFDTYDKKSKDKYVLALLPEGVEVAKRLYENNYSAKEVGIRISNVRANVPYQLDLVGKVQFIDASSFKTFGKSSVIQRRVGKYDYYDLLFEREAFGNVDASLKRSENREIVITMQ